MGLFSKLLELRSRHQDAEPEEDSFTEIIAQLFRRSHDILCQWLRALDVSLDKQYTDVHVLTQVHESGVIPDIWVRLAHDGSRDELEPDVASDEE